MLPKMDGFELCDKIRKKNLNTPIIMLTAKDEESDIVLGLSLGADDYVTKPFRIKELLARVEAFLRRRAKKEPDFYDFGDCRLDTVSSVLTRSGKEVKVSPAEFKMMHLFLKKTGCSLTCEEIRNTVWGYSRFITLQDIDSAVTALRNKIEPDPNNPVFIRTIEGIGYKFEPLD
jgi:two-component system alkaline phosphatase synthesis response regulator PhoP